MSDKILILAGVHGNEYSAVRVGLILKEFYKDDKRITVIPFSNPNGLLAGTRDIPNLNTQDLNRMFFQKDKTFEIISKAIDEHNIIIDIHNSPDCAPFVLLNNDKNLDNLIYWIENSNVEYVSRNSTANTIKKYCLNNEKIGITYEFGDMTKCTDSMLEKVLSDIKSLVDNSHLANCARDVDEDYVQKHELLSYIAHSYGYVYRLCNEGHIVEKGEDLFSTISEENTVLYKARKRMKVIIWNNNFVEDGSEVFQYIELDDGDAL